MLLVDQLLRDWGPQLFDNRLGLSGLAFQRSSSSNTQNRTPKNDISRTQLALPAEMGGLGVSAASLLALPAFLASAFVASDFLTRIFSETFEDVSFTKALEKWLSLTNEQESLLDGTQKNGTQPVYVKTAQDLIPRMDDKRSKIFNAHQGNFGSQWLNVVPCKNLHLTLDDQQLRISNRSRLGANICVAHTGWL